MVLSVRSLAWIGCLGFVAACGSGTDEAERLSAFDCLTSDACTQRLVVAHRGYHREQPENSLAAIRATAAVGADLVELDVRHTVDGALVLMHDSSVQRTTDGVGEVSELTLAEVQALLLDGGDPGDPESCRVPTFEAALDLARELGLLIYLDQKTDRTDLVLSAIQAGEHHRDVLVRDDWARLAPMLDEDGGLLVMPPITTLEEFGVIQAAFPGLRIVELALGGPSLELTEGVHAAGVRVQQDVLALGDVPALVGDYTGWKGFVLAGVDVLQTDNPQWLLPALRQFEQTGEFPDQGPPAM